MFVPQVVPIERLTGKAALARSMALVRADWLRVALLVALFIAIAWVARVLAGLLIPDSAQFLTELIGDVMTLVLMPVPVLALVLLYLDIRRRRDGFGAKPARPAGRAAGLAALTARTPNRSGRCSPAHGRHQRVAGEHVHSPQRHPELACQVVRAHQLAGGQLGSGTRATS